MQAEPLITWSEPVLQFISFLGLFFSAGAVGFRYSALRGRLTPVGAPAATSTPPGVAADRPIYQLAARRAAAIGLLGMLINVALLISELPGMAARKHLDVGAFVTSDFMTATQIALVLLALNGFVLASRATGFGWLLAAIGVVGVPVRGALLGQWSRLVNPLHVLSAGLWDRHPLCAPRRRSDPHPPPRVGARPAWTARRRHGQRLLATRPRRERLRRTVRRHNGVEAPHAAVLSVDNSLWFHINCEAAHGRDRRRVRRLQLAPPAPHARHLGRRGVDRPFGARRADDGVRRPPHHCSAGLSPVTTTAAGSRRSTSPRLSIPNARPATDMTNVATPPDGPVVAPPPINV